MADAQQAVGCEPALASFCAKDCSPKLGGAATYARFGRGRDPSEPIGWRCYSASALLCRYTNCYSTLLICCSTSLLSSYLTSHIIFRWITARLCQSDTLHSTALLRHHNSAQGLLMCLAAVD